MDGPSIAVFGDERTVHTRGVGRRAGIRVPPRNKPFV